jgi:DNA-binding NarL/FixJ family response regulator
MKKNIAPIRIILADDHEIFRDGFHVLLKDQLEIELVAEASNGRQLIYLAEKFNPDVILTDIKMPVMDGIEATKSLKEKFPAIAIIALSMFDDDRLIIDMIEAGAIGYLVKNAQKAEIIEAVKTVYQHNFYYCNTTSTRLAAMIAASKFNPYKPLPKIVFTDKEKEIITLICNEYSNKEISASIHLSVRTVEGYRDKIIEKMHVKNTAGIVVYAIRHNLFKP